MRLIDFQSTWLRLLIELFPSIAPIRRYRLVRKDIELRARRRIAREIRRQLGPRVGSR